MIQRIQVAILLLFTLIFAPKAISGCYDEWREAVDEARDSYYLPSKYCVNQILQYYSNQFDEATTFPIGRTVNGRIIYALRLTHPDGRMPVNERPSVLFVGSQHGSESSSTRSLLDWIDHLLTKPYQLIRSTSSIRNRKLLKERQIWVLPVANLDGFGHSGGNGTRCNANAVNLNRDLPVHWALNTDSPKTDACKGNKNRTGPWPVSQSETLTIMNAVTLAQPAVVMNGHGHRTGITGKAYPLEEPTDGSVQRAEWTKSTSIDWNTGDNWSWVGHYAQYEWDVSLTPPGYKISLGPNPWGLAEIAQHTARDDSNQPNNLPLLSEHRSAGTRHYAPYSSTYAYDSRSFSQQGRSRGPFRGGLQGWTWIGSGAVSFLLEHLRLFEDGAYGVHEDEKHWAQDRDERHIGELSKDTFPAYARLAEIAENPVPEVADFSVNSAFNDLAVTRVQGMHESCQALRTWWDPTVGPNVDTDANVLPETLLRGPAGEIDLNCTISNWGTKSGTGISAEISVIRTNDRAIIGSESYSRSALGAGQSLTFGLSRSVELLDDVAYDVRCEITGGTEEAIARSDSASTTNVRQVEIIDDQACLAEEAKIGTAPYRCIPNTSGGYDTIWDTNNARSLRFVAQVAVEDACSVSPISMTGIPASHIIPAVVALP